MIAASIGTSGPSEHDQDHLGAYSTVPFQPFAHKAHIQGRRSSFLRL